MENISSANLILTFKLIYIHFEINLHYEEAILMPAQVATATSAL